ncbi:9-cis epoxycarotenoid dioxygenase [Rhynchospora pubera]|uniref:9-cis epoxycarotenoid dioxygenase n=1 Tax=Rhynchospora pubera TaxID=906938 RepID=A0AAV8DU21_9POAL|nr:9-cis epoxycarotenoid dioxygenase [Rhynchospora pubera]
MEVSTAHCRFIRPSSKNLRTKRSHFLPAFTIGKPPLLSPPSLPLLSALPSKPFDRSTTANVAAPEITLPMAFCNALEHIINAFIDPAMLHPFVDPCHDLTNNFMPVDELPPTRCHIIRGSIPPCLVGGAYIRNGPNPQYLPQGPRHLFEGDGMLHSLLLSADGDPMLCSRYVQTYKYCLERNAGAPVMPNFFSGSRGFAGLARRSVTLLRILTGQINLTQGIGLANTSLAFFGGCLYALGESDLPYAMRVDPATGDISTVGRCDFKGRLVRAMTAHPKKDPVTGEVFAFSYAPVRPFLTYFRFDPSGNKSGDVPIFSVMQPTLMHDFAITENYALFNDIQLVMKPMEMVLGIGAPVGYNATKKPRLGVLPRYAANESEIRWFEIPGFNMFHSINAWEEEGANGEKYLVLVAPNLLPVEHSIEQIELMHNCVHMVRINLDTGVVSRKPLSADNLDLGVIHPSYMGRRNRYAYLGIGNPWPKVSGIAKLDFSLTGKGHCVIATREFDPGCFGGEPFFVPNDGSEEDDGYLLSFVHNERTGESRFVVMDACSPKLDIVAEVLLPRRVPYGFHGLFISRSELLSQQYLL